MTLCCVTHRPKDKILARPAVHCSGWRKSEFISSVEAPRPLVGVLHGTMFNFTCHAVFEKIVGQVA